MQSGQITDNQISSTGRDSRICFPAAYMGTDDSYQYFNSKYFFMYRLFADRPLLGVNARAGQLIRKESFLQVDLQQLHTITGMMIQGFDIFVPWDFFIHFDGIHGEWLTYRNIDGSIKVHLIIVDFFRVTLLVLGRFIVLDKLRTETEKFNIPV